MDRRRLGPTAGLNAVENRKNTLVLAGNRTLGEDGFSFRSFTTHAANIDVI
jgi:hypothetical protein